MFYKKLYKHKKRSQIQKYYHAMHKTNKINKDSSKNELAKISNLDNNLVEESFYL